jgi:hypothetical protein
MKPIGAEKWRQKQRWKQARAIKNQTKKGEKVIKNLKYKNGNKE